MRKGDVYCRHVPVAIHRSWQTPAWMFLHCEDNAKSLSLLATSASDAGLFEWLFSAIVARIDRKLSMQCKQIKRLSCLLTHIWKQTTKKLFVRCLSIVYPSSTQALWRGRAEQLCLQRNYTHAINMVLVHCGQTLMDRADLSTFVSWVYRHQSTQVSTIPTKMRKNALKNPSIHLPRLRWCEL